MISCTQLQAEAAGLAALANDDPERVMAFAHAHHCQAGCREALQEAEDILRLLDEEAAPASLAPALLQQVARPILADLAARRRSSGVLWAAPAAVLAAWLIPLAARRRLALAPGLGASLGLAAAAAVGTAAVMAWGGVWLGAIPLASLLAALVSGDGSGLAPAVGAHCLTFEVGWSLLPVAVTALWLRGRPAGHVPPAGRLLAASAAGGALAGQAALHLLCHAPPTVDHQLLFHTGGVFLAGLLGLLLARTRGRSAV